MIDLRRLRYFLALSDELHFGRAAARLHIAQPPLTRQISTLESELGFRLFNRSTRKVLLTSEGKKFLPHARSVLDQVDKMMSISKKLAKGTDEHLSVGYSSSIALSEIFSGTIHAFFSAHPEVDLSLEEGACGTQWAQLVEGRLDIGLSYMQPSDKHAEIQTICLGKEPLAAAVASNNPLAQKEKVTLAELSTYPLITFPSDYGSGLKEAFNALYQRQAPPPIAAPKGNQITSIIALVAAGRGVAVVPQCTQALSANGVIYRPLADPEANVPLLVLTRKRKKNALVNAFIEIVEQHCSRVYGLPPMP